MSDYATAEEVRAWYASRGFSEIRLTKSYVDGWNKAHPDRPYVKDRHGTHYLYSLGCRCQECLAVKAQYDKARYEALKETDA